MTTKILIDKKLCPYCKHSNDINDKFCLTCGRPIQDISGVDKEWRRIIKKA